MSAEIHSAFMLMKCSSHFLMVLVDAKKVSLQKKQIKMEKKKKMVCEDRYMWKVKRMFARIKTGGGKDKI